MAADTDAYREIVEEDQLVSTERAWIVRCLARRSERQRVSDRAHRRPRRAATIRLPAAEGSRASELQRVGALQLRALYDVIDRRESIPASRCLQSLERFLAESADVTPADS